ncbi:TPA: hypothetical protein RUZ94_003486 [Vibrio cholerae]|uniref:hypothetical protein n=1 Tax=Vibrio cholerae TaxID=666 RepID=UPI000E0B5F45|nr:hypothetical protein [Vibrio cholerae]MCD6648210.1 hypothetical protein [Vibrio cholerae]TQP23311.1 hypothetical protein FLM00_13305 [Vibrio cholerae]TQQ18845.1 hypothetical protein FLL85_18215 [Vibrio cholerae]GHW72904.1 hypothetical protein VCSRO103_3558 [Vibrio cholerae]HDZ9290923.1 hypothetical protein [Vibrio cholerae]
MNDARVIVSRLSEWAKKNQVPIIDELNRIEHELSEFYRKPVVELAEKSPTKKKPKKKKLKNASVAHSDGRCTEQINFKVKKVVIPVKGTCHFCSLKGVSQDVYKLTNSKEVIVCAKCVKKQRKKNQIKNKVVYVDAMERVVSGCYGSGKKSR